MKYKYNMFTPFLSIVSGIILILLSGCGEGSFTTDDDSSGTGSIAFSIVLKGSPAEGEDFLPAQVDCGLISTVRADVYDGSGNIAGSGGPWDCEVHRGTISGIRPGTNYSVRVFGMNLDGSVIYQGEKTGITVTAGQTTNAGEIVLELVSTLVWGVGRWDEATWGP